MASKPSPVFAVRSSTGIEVWKSDSFKQPYKLLTGFEKDEGKVGLYRAITFSDCGKYLAWSNGRAVQIASTETWKVITTLPRPKCYNLKFSSKSTYLMTFEIFTTTKDNPTGNPNLYIYKTETGEEVYSVIQKKQADWEPQWSADEQLMALMIGGEAYFFEVNSETGFNKCVKKLGGGRNGGISMSPGNFPPNFAFYVPGVKGAPSMCKLFKYPNLEATQPIAQKSFFQADRVEMFWNKRGTGLIIMTSTEVDATGVSYYGKQALHFLSAKGDSYGVQLTAEGPIHGVAWSPNSKEFCVCYGFMPAKATMFNLKCDPVFEFGTGVRNSLYFNDFGTLLLFGGFGNLRGNIEVWDLKQKKKISSTEAPDSTLLEWSPIGDIFLTATTAPRLRMGNGFKVFHYSGALLHETIWPEKQELLEVIWQRFPEGSILEPHLTAMKVVGIAPSQPTASKAKYVPPNVRNFPAGTVPGVPIIGGTEPVKKSTIPGMPPGYTSSKDTKKNKKSKKTANEGESPRPAQTKQNGQNGNETWKRATAAELEANEFADDKKPSSSLESEKEKKCKGIQNKLNYIKKLKEKLDNGIVLAPNQLKKVDSEKDLVAELAALNIA